MVPLEAVLEVDHAVEGYVCWLVVILKIEFIPDLKRAPDLLAVDFDVNAVFAKHQDVILAPRPVQRTHKL
jgi:hypothetical protein